MRILLSTRNRGKLAELEALLAGREITLMTLDDVPDAPIIEEDRATLEGNARKKALALHEFTGQITVADDTGLEVDALEGAPGVHSARFAGPDADDERNRILLLEQLEGTAARTARFKTIIALVVDGDAQLFEGICEGHITHSPRGSSGFGYDPIFVPEGAERTFAEMSPEEKNAISHRGIATRHLARYLRTLSGAAGLQHDER